MRSNSLLWVGSVTIITVGIIILATALLSPENTHPAYDVAVRFVNAAATGDDQTAVPLLSDAMQDYVAENCPEGRVSACLQAYTPPEWGALLTAEFRRSRPDANAWDILLVALYEEGEGFSGVCIYNRVEEALPGRWRVSAWSGFISCAESNAGLSGLRREDAPNRAP